MKQMLYVNLQVEKNDRIYIFSMPVGAPLGEAHDVAHECLQEIIKMAQQAAEAAASKQKGEDDGN